MNSYLKNESFSPTPRYDSSAKAMVMTNMPKHRLYPSCDFFWPFRVTSSFNSRNCDVSPISTPAMPKYIVRPITVISVLSLSGIASSAFKRLPNKSTPPALIPITDLVNELVASLILVSKSSEFFMERFSFQRMLVQRLGRIGILGETLRPYSISDWSAA